MKLTTAFVFLALALQSQANAMIDLGNGKGGIISTRDVLDSKFVKRSPVGEGEATAAAVKAAKGPIKWTAGKVAAATGAAFGVGFGTGYGTKAIVGGSSRKTKGASFDGPPDGGQGPPMKRSFDDSDIGEALEKRMAVGNEMRVVSSNPKHKFFVRRSFDDSDIGEALEKRMAVGNEMRRGPPKRTHILPRSFDDSDLAIAFEKRAIENEVASHGAQGLFKAGQKFFKTPNGKKVAIAGGVGGTAVLSGIIGDHHGRAAERTKISKAQAADAGITVMKRDLRSLGQAAGQTVGEARSTAFGIKNDYRNAKHQIKQEAKGAVLSLPGIRNVNNLHQGYRSGLMQAQPVYKRDLGEEDASLEKRAVPAAGEAKAVEEAVQTLSKNGNKIGKGIIAAGAGTLGLISYGIGHHNGHQQGQIAGMTHKPAGSTMMKRSLDEDDDIVLEKRGAGEGELVAKAFNAAKVQGGSLGKTVLGLGAAGTALGAYAVGHHNGKASGQIMGMSQKPGSGSTGQMYKRSFEEIDDLTLEKRAAVGAEILQLKPSKGLGRALGAGAVFVGTGGYLIGHHNGRQKGQIQGMTQKSGSSTGQMYKRSLDEDLNDELIKRAVPGFAIGGAAIGGGLVYAHHIGRQKGKIEGLQHRQGGGSMGGGMYKREFDEELSSMSLEKRGGRGKILAAGALGLVGGGFVGHRMGQASVAGGAPPGGPAGGPPAPPMKRSLIEDQEVEMNLEKRCGGGKGPGGFGNGATAEAPPAKRDFQDEIDYEKRGLDASESKIDVAALKQRVKH